MAGTQTPNPKTFDFETAPNLKKGVPMMHQKMNGAKFIAETFKGYGITHVFLSKSFY